MTCFRYQDYKTKTIHHQNENLNKQKKPPPNKTDKNSSESSSFSYFAVTNAEYDVCETSNFEV